MMRIAARAVISVLANALALVVADLLLDDVSLSAVGFVIAAALFTGVTILIEPLMRQVAIKNAPVLLGSSSLVATLVSLIVTVVVSNGLHITGLTTWVLATVVVWAVALAGQLLLPLIIFKKILAKRASESS